MESLHLLRATLALSHTLLFAAAFPLALRIDLPRLGLRPVHAPPSAARRRSLRLLGLLCGSGLLLLGWSYLDSGMLAPLATAKLSIVALLMLGSLSQRAHARHGPRQADYARAAIGIAQAAFSLSSWLFVVFLCMLDTAGGAWRYGELMTAYLSWLLLALYTSAALLRPRLNCPQEQ